MGDIINLSISDVEHQLRKVKFLFSFSFFVSSVFVATALWKRCCLILPQEVVDVAQAPRETAHVAEVQRRLVG